DRSANLAYFLEEGRGSTPCYLVGYTAVPEADDLQSPELARRDRVNRRVLLCAGVVAGAALVLFGVAAHRQRAGHAGDQVLVAPPPVPPAPTAHPSAPIEPLPRLRFARTFDVSSFRRGNLHTHSNRSDGDAEPLEVYKWYRDHGYAFVLIT